MLRMLRTYTHIAAVAVLLVPAVTRAQPYYSQAPVAFTGPTRTYAVSGCGDGPLSFFGGPSVRLFCIDGTATVGARAGGGPGGYDFFQVVLDLTGTRYNGFDGQFFDVDYSNIQFPTTYRENNGRTFTLTEGFGPPADPTGHWRFGYTLFPPVEEGVPNGLPRDAVSFGSPGAAQLGFVPSDAPAQDPFMYGRYFPFALSVTAVPEPAPLALTAAAFSGVALLGAAARRRRA